MPARLVLPLLILLAVPALSQHSNIQTRIAQHVDQREQQISQAEPSASVDVRAARLQALHRDAHELSVLNASVQSDLQKLQQGMLVKDLNTNLKKLEKLSKKVRQELQ